MCRLHVLWTDCRNDFAALGRIRPTATLLKPTLWEDWRWMAFCHWYDFEVLLHSCEKIKMWLTELKWASIFFSLFILSIIVTLITSYWFSFVQFFYSLHFSGKGIIEKEFAVAVWVKRSKPVCVLAAVGTDDFAGAPEKFGASYIHRLPRRSSFSISDHASSSYW